MQINDEILYQPLTYNQEKDIFELIIRLKTFNYVLLTIKKRGFLAMEDVKMLNKVGIRLHEFFNISDIKNGKITFEIFNKLIN